MMITVKGGIIKNIIFKPFHCHVLCCIPSPHMFNGKCKFQEIKLSVIAEVKEGIQKLSFIGVVGQNTKDKEKHHL